MSQMFELSTDWPAFILIGIMLSLYIYMVVKSKQADKKKKK